MVRSGCLERLHTVTDFLPSKFLTWCLENEEYVHFRLQVIGKMPVRVNILSSWSTEQRVHNSPRLRPAQPLQTQDSLFVLFEVVTDRLWRKEWFSSNLARTPTLTLIKQDAMSQHGITISIRDTPFYADNGPTQTERDKWKDQ